MKIAVIGGGISGLGAAWLLKDKHQVTLFEKDDRLGGHAHAETVEIGGRKVTVDTAFIVFNKHTYPNLVSFFETLQIPIDPIHMVLSVSLNDGKFEWSTKLPNGLFADRRNLYRPSFWKLLLEIQRFNKVARKELKALEPEETTRSFLDRHGFSHNFRREYFFPLTGAIWSTPATGVDGSPAKSVLSFLNNHGALQMSRKERLDWYTVNGSSRTYIKALEDELLAGNCVIRTGMPVHEVDRRQDRVSVATRDGKEEFDYVVFATHANTTLSLMRSPSEAENRLLSPFAYAQNKVVLHSDERLMPRRKRAWGTWAYFGRMEEIENAKKANITYYMNALQRIDTTQPVLVTLNPVIEPLRSKTYDHYTYSHPIFSTQAIRAQKELPSLQARNRSLFCGSYFGYGFHEDGLKSAMDAVAHLGITAPWKH